MGEGLKAAFLDRDSLDLGDLDLGPLTRSFVELSQYGHTPVESVVERLAGCQVVIANKTLLRAEALDAAPALKLILIAATGTNNVDLDTARARGITVCNCRGYGTPSVAQHTLMLLLGLATRAFDYRDDVRAGRWQTATQFCLLDHPIVELSGRSLGIVGYGELGQAVGRLAEAFGMTVRIAQLPGRPVREGAVPFAELLGQVDALSLHCPLTAETRGLIGARELAAMKPGAFLINTGRGGLVDEPALVEALRSGHLGGAGFDVLTAEPPRADHPLLATDVPRLIVTPHNAWGSREARQRIVAQLAENVSAFVAGSPIRVVG